MDRESGWNSTILIHWSKFHNKELETFLMSLCLCTPVYEAFMDHSVSPCTSLGLISYSLETGMLCECCTKRLLSARVGVSYLSGPCRGSSRDYSMMSLKARAHAALSSLPWGLSDRTCSGGDTKPRYCLLDLVNFFSSLVKEMPFLLSSRAACKS